MTFTRLRNFISLRIALLVTPKHKHDWLIVGAAGGPAMMDCLGCPATNYGVVRSL
jgi:hypothetical protein